VIFDRTAPARAHFRNGHSWHRTSNFVQMGAMQHTAIATRPSRSRFLSVPAACVHLNISRSKLYELLAEGALKAQKLGQRTLLRLEDLDQFLEALPQATFRNR
jgi:excisionase family DNA binding protein